MNINRENEKATYFIEKNSYRNHWIIQNNRKYFIIFLKNYNFNYRPLEKINPINDS